ncbi:hypothetical protein BDY21DRAFT_24905 [Lineolata rhizophorae]|uniref:Uncharacterized protein n=1 Tax=Lineolata rhizophorae TaxID=578093 RepID=A0A6A6P059_9PEZI|nr:hypothetical protein BDY21DRAFT_24905 [Lineolata rhizophorae]
MRNGLARYITVRAVGYTLGGRQTSEQRAPCPHIKPRDPSRHLATHSSRIPASAYVCRRAPLQACPPHHPTNRPTARFDPARSTPHWQHTRASPLPNHILSRRRSAAPWPPSATVRAGASRPRHASNKRPHRTVSMRRSNRPPRPHRMYAFASAPVRQLNWPARSTPRSFLDNECTRYDILPPSSLSMRNSCRC